MKKQNIRYIPLSHYLSNDKEKQKPSTFMDDVIKIVGLISAGSVIFAAIFYIFGRNYAAGYFGAMDIPEFMLTFSIWEYGVVAWFPMVFLLVINVVVFIVFPILVLILIEPLKAIRNKLTKKKIHKTNFWHPFVKNYYEQIMQIFIGIIIISGFFFVLPRIDSYQKHWCKRRKNSSY